MPTIGEYLHSRPGPTHAQRIAKLMARGCTRAQAEKRAWRR